ncbi:hypothetical protein Tco_0347890 [Tanacetum coccineum]
MESLNSNSQERELHQLQQMQDKAKESCMASFRLLHSVLKVLSNDDLKGTSIDGGFERAFASLFDQDVQTFTGLMLLNLDLLEKQLDKEEFQETRSMDAFRVLKKQFQRFINFRYYFDDFDVACDEAVTLHFHIPLLSSQIFPITVIKQLMAWARSGIGFEDGQIVNLQTNYIFLRFWNLLPINGINAT